MLPPSPFPPGWMAFALVAAVYLALASRAVHYGFSDPGATLRWARVLGAIDAGDLSLRAFLLPFPYLPSYLLLPLALRVLRQPLAPSILSAMLVAFTVTCAPRGAFRSHTPVQRLWLVRLMVAFHPFTLYLATSGDRAAFLFLLYWAMAAALGLFLVNGTRNPLIILSMAALVGYLSDERYVFVTAAALLLMWLLMVRSRLRGSYVAVYLAILLPLLIYGAVFGYLDWRDHGGVLGGVGDIAAYTSGWGAAIPSAWQKAWGSEWYRAPLLLAGIALAAFPLGLHWRASAPGRRRVLPVLLAIPLLGGLLANGVSLLDQPVTFLGLLGAAILGLIVADPSRLVRSRLVLGLIAAGWFGSLGAMVADPSGGFSRWMAAVAGVQVAPLDPGGTALGAWLADNKVPVLIDETAGAPVIAAKGDAFNLVLSFDPRFTDAIATHRLSIEGVAMRDPGLDPQHLDRLQQAFPSFYASGAPGYRLVYDWGGWRLWRLDSFVAGGRPAPRHWSVEGARKVTSGPCVFQTVSALSRSPASSPSRLVKSLAYAPSGRRPRDGPNHPARERPRPEDGTVTYCNPAVCSA